MLSGSSPRASTATHRPIGFMQSSRRACTVPRNVLFPVIPIVLAGKVIQFDALALLDSGADVSAIPVSLAELLGLKTAGKQVEETAGIGGSVRSIATNMGIIVVSKDGRERYPMTIPVHVILNPNSDEREVPILFGR